MGIEISEQTKLFFTILILGMGIGLVYDIFRILRKLFKHPDYLTHLEDFIYWVFVTFMMFYFILTRNYGELRLFSIIGSVIGMVLYFLTLSIFFIEVSLVIIGIIKRILFIVFKIIYVPLKIIYVILSVSIKLIILIITPFMSKFNKSLKKIKSYAKIKSNKLISSIKIIIKKV